METHFFLGLIGSGVLCGSVTVLYGSATVLYGSATVLYGSATVLYGSCAILYGSCAILYGAICGSIIIIVQSYTSKKKFSPFGERFYVYTNEKKHDLVAWRIMPKYNFIDYHNSIKKKKKQ